MGSGNAVALKDLDPKQWLDPLREQHGLARNFVPPKNWLEDWLLRLPPAARDEARRVWLARQQQSVGDVMTS